MVEAVDENFEEFNVAVKNLSEFMDSLIRPLNGLKIPNELAENIKTYQENQKIYESIGSILDDQTLEKAYMHAHRMCVFGRSIFRSPRNGELIPDAEARSIAISLIDVVEDYVKNRPVLMVSADPPDLNAIEFVEIKSVESQLRDLAKELEALSVGSVATVSRLSDVDRSLSEISERIDRKFEQFGSAADSRFSGLIGDFDKNKREINKLFEQLKSELVLKEKNIDAFIGNLTRKALSGGYMRSAIKEERLANGFRTAAIVLMIVLAIYVLGTIAHMELMNLDRQTAGLRVFGALFFSFVIAYLIRQAGVHRAQYQRHHQTALDLRAIDSYAADLPREIKDAIKQQIAEKIFVPKEIHAATDAGGFGAQEIIAKVIDKLELPKAGK